MKESKKQVKTVLIVDDDPLIQKMLEKALKRSFLNTRTAGTGMEALKIFEAFDIDILLLDINLPDMNGLSILKICKEKKPECEVIVITGIGTEEIAVKSLRNGAIDYVEKPLREEDLLAALGRAQEKLDERDKFSFKNTILVIDDEEQITLRLEKFFIKEGFDVFHAFSGSEGIKALDAYQIDVIITDIGIPDINGIELLKRAKKIHSGIEGIVITGNAKDDQAIRALRAGAIDYITKPVDLDELLFSVNKAIERIKLYRNRLFRNRELKLSQEIVSKMNEELERRIDERSKQLSKTQAQLFQTSKLATLGEMSAGLAHEMNQPLGGISLVIQGMRKLKERDILTDEELDSSICDIDKSVKRMTKIINHIRTFARQDTLKFIEVNINDTIDSSINLMGEQLRLHDIELELDLSKDLPKIKGEPYQLEQVWINFISNAIDSLDEKFLKLKKGNEVKSPGKKMIIKTIFNNEKKSIDVIFTDNGLGVSEDVKEKMLQPFFTTKEVGKATGLGLSISYGIVETHKGTLKISGKLGEGAKITVSLYEMVK